MSEPVWLSPGQEGPYVLLRQLLRESMTEPHVDFLPHFMRAHGIPDTGEGSAVGFLIDHFARHLSVALFQERRLEIERVAPMGPLTAIPGDGTGFLCVSCLKERLTCAQGFGMSREPMKCKRHPGEEMLPWGDAAEKSREGA